MRVVDILQARSFSVSFEFFPPKTDPGWAKLFETIRSLLPLDPAYVSVTYGAGGSTRDNTHKLVQRLSHETELTVVAHLTCVSSRRHEMKSILDSYTALGVENILALKGDIPMKGPKDDGDFSFAADLVAFIRKNYPHICIGVAGFPEGHPMTPNRLVEIEHLKEKVDAGADYIVTQLFFDNRDYYDFVERCRIAGINVPIIPGIMPITSRKTMSRMADLAAGARFPAPLLKSIARAQDESLVTNVGSHWATSQIQDLIDHAAPGVHLYTLNTSKSTAEICAQLGLSSYHLAE